MLTFAFKDATRTRRDIRRMNNQRIDDQNVLGVIE